MSIKKVGSWITNGWWKMIKTATIWHCTLCGHSKSYDPLVGKPPKNCPACNDGKNTPIYTTDKK